MTARLPLVFGDDGLPQRMQVGDSLNLTAALAVALGGTGVTTALAELSRLGFAVSATTSGYLKIPTGSGTVLILQWGQATVASSGAASVSFPVTFPNGILGRPVCTPEGSSNTIVLGVQTSSITASGFQGNMTFASGGSTGACNGNSFDWWALGY